jgi:uncharacterized protein (TIGR02466 family)
MNHIKQLEIQGVFPTPVGFYKFEREFTENEKKFIKKHYKKPIKNQGNLVSNNNYILDYDEMKNIKENMLICVKDFLYNVLCADGKQIEPYITQSWLNYTNINQYHHKHAHPNSLISGVFYIDTDEEDKITFVDDSHKQIKIYPIDYNLWNSQTWWFSAKKFTILLFPSHLSHMVGTKKNNNIRTSLSFNTFVKGVIGINSELTELKL